MIAVACTGVVSQVAQAAQPLPDLRVKRVSDPPAAAHSGDSWTVSSKLKNAGEADVGSTRSRYYLSLDGRRGAGDVELEGSQRFPGLDAGESDQRSTDLGVPVATPAGLYLLLSCADDPDRRREESEKNNCSASDERTSLTPNQIVPPAVSMVVAPTAVNPAEGSTAQFDVHLDAAPTSPVTVTVASNDTAKATVSTSSLTFTPANFATNQSVTVTGAQDVNLADESTSVTLSSPGLSTVSVTVDVTDDDTQAIVASPTTVSPAEGATGQFSVHLAFQPSSNVTVNVASGDTGVATASPSALTFTPANFAADQLVTVTGAQDSDAANESTPITLSSPGLSAVNVTANVTDDDTQAIVASPTTVNTTEGGNTQFDVHLAFQPASNVTVTVASNDTAKATVSTSSLTFTPANFATNQSVTVTGAQDVNLANESTGVTLSSPGVANVGVTVNVTDDDTQAIVASPTTVNLAEGSIGGFNVHLAFQEPFQRTVNVGSGDPGAATASPSVLTFGPADFGSDKPVSVTGVQDADSADESVTVAVSSPGLTTVNVTVNVADDD